jgi:hypothetical protein
MISPRIYSHSLVGSRSSYIAMFSLLGAFWGTVFVGACMALWGALAISVMWLTKSGNWSHLSTWNWFIHFNVSRLIHKVPPFWAPPTKYGTIIMVKTFLDPYYPAWAQEAGEEWPRWVVLTDKTAGYKVAPPFPVTDCTSYYWDGGTYNGKKWYLDAFGKWFIWWELDRWWITNKLGWHGGDHRWYRIDESPIGKYVPNLPEDTAAYLTP